MNNLEDAVEGLENWQIALSGRTVELRLNRVGEWVVTLWEDGFIISSADDTSLHKAIAKLFRATSGTYYGQAP